MIRIKKYKVITKNGKVQSQLFETVKDAMKEVGVSNIKSLQETYVSDDVSEKTIDKRVAAVIARKTDNEIQASLKSHNALVYNRPVFTKVFDGMTVLEVGETKVLETTLYSVARFDKNLFKEWKDMDTDYEWALQHTAGKVITIDEAKSKYKELEAVSLREGVITYMSTKR